MIQWVKGGSLVMLNNWSNDVDVADIDYYNSDKSTSAVHLLNLLCTR